MKWADNHPHVNRNGSALILSLVFLVMFSALAAAMATRSGVNVQVAENQRKLDKARASAESGLEVVRYWMSKVSMSGTLAPSQRFQALADSLESELANAGITNIMPYWTSTTISLPDITLNSVEGQSFTAVLTKIDDDNIQLDVTGQYGPVSRTIRSYYQFGTRANTVFDYGVASKGPVALSGNVELEGVTIDVESNAYIESGNALVALSITGNSNIAGQVKIGNSMGIVDLQGGQAGIGGVTGEEATQPPYTEYGVPPTEFPEMVTAPFESFVTATLDPATDTTSNVTLENVRIPEGMNPTFSGQATLRGVIWVEAPNVVTFAGPSNVIGIIIGDGDPIDDSGDNRICFEGHVNSLPVSQLPQEEAFAGLHDQLGTFVIAPGFHVSFGGTFDALSGVIAGNGIEFYGNAGGTINGSIINYGDNQMILSGNSDLYFNRSGLSEMPAGFVPEIVLHYDPSSYSEVIL